MDAMDSVLICLKNDEIKFIIQIYFASNFLVTDEQAAEAEMSPDGAGSRPQKNIAIDVIKGVTGFFQGLSRL